MKDRILTLAIFVISVLGLSAQTIVGDWEGQLDVQGTQLKVVFHIKQNGDLYSSTMDSPNQGAFDIEMDNTTFDGTTLTIKNSQMSMETVAKYDEDGDLIEGSFNQGPMKLPITLVRVAQEEKSEPTNNHPIAGDWNTELDVMGTQLRLIFHITESEGVLSTSMDSPDQGAFGLAVDTTIADGNDITMTAKAMGINVSGTYLPDSNIIRAKFLQGPLNEDIVLRRDAIEKKEMKRPQEPKSFDYKVEEVQFSNPIGGHNLAGTLTIPKSGKYNKVVILVSGSGPQDRNEELLGHKPFLVLSDYLTRNGIAVLRYDDRGVGESTGDFGSATSMDFAMDATAAVEYLRSRNDMKGKKIGVMGHSEGGLIAPIVADKTTLDFAVLLAGPGTDSDDLLLEQTAAISRANGGEEEDIAFSNQSSRLIFDYIKENQEMSTEELRKNLKDIFRKEFEKLSDEKKEEIGDVDAMIDSQIKSVTTVWFRYFLAYQPSDYLSKLTIPVLAVNGSLDMQVLSESNLKGIQDNLKKSGNKNVTIKEFPGLNHLFQMSADGTGSPNEYGKLEETFNQEAMEFITDWVINFDK